MGKSTALRFLVVGVLVVFLARAGVEQASSRSAITRTAVATTVSTPSRPKAQAVHEATVARPTTPATPSPLPRVAATPASSPHQRVGIYLGSYNLAQASVLNEVLARAKEGLLNAVVINVKDNHGEVTYSSAVPLAKEIKAATGGLNLASLLPILKHNGIYLIARQVVFDDPKLAAYLKSPQAPWVVPTDERAVSYNLDIANEVAALGFDEIQFDYIRYPDGGGLTSGYSARYAAIDRFVERAKSLLAGRVYVSADLFGRVMWSWNAKRTDPIGQSLEDMALHMDILSPMLYPSHYYEQVYKSDPYRVVKETLATGKNRVATPFRPYLQAFDMAIPPGMSLEAYIRAQIKAAVECGADGYLFWNPSCDYRALFRALRQTP
jgi:hypothetical protein